MTGIPMAATVMRLGRDDTRLLFQIARDGIRSKIDEQEVQLLRARMFPDDPIPHSLSQERSRAEDAFECERSLVRLRQMLNIVLWSLDALSQKSPEEFAEMFAEILREPTREVH